jgi:hypothetical protein
MYKNKKAVCAVIAACCAVLLATASRSDTPRLTDAQIRQLIVEASVLSYPGNCPCPYNVDSAGRRCGARSAFDRAGGYSPICFPAQISDEQVREYRDRHRV